MGYITKRLLLLLGINTALFAFNQRYLHDYLTLCIKNTLRSQFTNIQNFSKADHWETEHTFLALIKKNMRNLTVKCIFKKCNN